MPFLFVLALSVSLHSEFLLSCPRAAGPVMRDREVRQKIPQQKVLLSHLAKITRSVVAVQEGSGPMELGGHLTPWPSPPKNLRLGSYAAQ